jgi:hypothetical protein
MYKQTAAMDKMSLPRYISFNTPLKFITTNNIITKKTRT